MKGNLLAVALVATCFANASVVNGSFEDPVIATGTYTTVSIPGWSKGPTGDFGVWNIPLAGFFNAEAPDGTNIGYMNGHFLAQQTDNVLAVGETTLTLMGGRRHDSFAGSFTARLIAGGTLADGVVTGGTLLSESTFSHIDHDPDSFSLVTVTYDALDGDASLGKLLTIQIERVGGSQANFDDVRLHVDAVPEPGTMAALSLGLTALIRRRRV